MISYLREQEVYFQFILNLNNNDFLFKGVRSRFPVTPQFTRQWFLIYGSKEVDFQLLLNLPDNDFLFKGVRSRFPVNSQFK